MTDRITDKELAFAALRGSIRALRGEGASDALIREAITAVATEETQRAEDKKSPHRQ